MKNSLYIVYGGLWDDETGMYKHPTDITITTFKNREKAESCVDKLLESYMRMKSYSLNYTIESSYIDEENPLKPTITNITDKHGVTAFSVEVVEINLSKTIM